MNLKSKNFSLITLILIFLFAQQATYAASANDPLEGYNRAVYKFNDKLDKAILRPVATWYSEYIPGPLKSTVNNFYNNLRDFVSLGNDIIQLDGEASMENLMRVGINSTFGIFGLIDVASSLGLKHQSNSFGNTLKHYGWKNSSYFVIPFFGPSTIRDAIGFIPDIYFNPTWYVVDNNYASVGLFAVSAIDRRSQFLEFDQTLDLSIDPYAALRDFYLQARGESIINSTESSSNGVDIDTLLNESE